jgi:hypothetical protein
MSAGFLSLMSFFRAELCLKLPFPACMLLCPCRHPTFGGRHTPKLKSLQRHHQVVSMKVWLARQLLKLSGRSKQAAALHNGYKAFAVQNTPG